MSASFLALLLASTVVGLVVGGAFFTLLRLNVRLYASHRWPVGIALHFARWALLVAALLVAARAGALPLLLLAGGTLIARLAVVRATPEAHP